MSNAKLSRACVLVLNLFFFICAPRTAYPQAKAAGNTADALFPPDETRALLLQKNQQNAAAYERAEIPFSELGDWRDAIQNSLFTVLRKTEATREPCRIIVYDEQAVAVNIEYAENELIARLSSGTLDFIDSYLFSAIGGVARRIKNVSQERERLLTPLAAVAAAHYALDHQYVNIKNGGANGYEYAAYSRAQILEADRFAAILLAAAEIPPNSLAETLRILGEANEQTNGVSPPDRVLSLSEFTRTNEKLFAVITSALDNLRFGIGLNDAVNDLKKLKETYPSALYLDRLTAQAIGKQWYESQPKGAGRLKPFFCSGSYGGLERNKTAGANLNNGGEDLFKTARAAYESILANQKDPYILSEYAILLALHDGADDFEFALKAAETAARGESADGTIARRANYASVLFITAGAHKKQRRARIDSALSLSAEISGIGYETPESDLGARVFAGFVGNAKLAAYNESVMRSILSGKDDLADYSSSRSGDSAPARGITLRGARVGDSIDAALEKWSRPDEIIYDYYSEQWIYTELSMRAAIENGTIARVTISIPSVITLPGDLRAGDSKEDFETVFGKPINRIYDALVYRYEGQTIFAEYLSGLARKITIAP